MFGFCKLCPHHAEKKGCAFPSKGDYPTRVLEIDRLELEPNQLLSATTADARITYIREGWAYSFRTTESGGRTVGGFYTAGDVLGMPLFFSRDFHYSARAMSKLKVCSVSMDEFTNQVRRQDSYFEYFLREGSRLLWLVSDRAYDLTHRSAEERLCRAFLLIFLRACGGQSDQFLKIPVTQELLADLVGTSKIHINRLLVKLKKDGVCHISHGSMTVFDWNKLMLRANVTIAEYNRWAKINAIQTAIQAETTAMPKN